ncbi:hypothetical protein BD779DRAFT_1477377 [Infundibulicybe gibba]|nr:hypothetical protein BD779DRAFT_1477377 [Infundibulicybe gibba]
MDDRACSLGTALLPPQSTSGSVGQNIHAFQEARENELITPTLWTISAAILRSVVPRTYITLFIRPVHAVYDSSRGLEEVEALGLLVTTSAQRQLQLQNHWRTGYENGVEYELLVPRGLVQPTGVIFPAWETP